MNVRMICQAPPPELAAKLEAFESAFTYPLGPERSFRISHSPDCTRFYRSMGNAACFIAEQADQVIGTLSVAIRALSLPDGTALQAAYIGDLKIRTAARSSRALLRLAQAADDWARPQVTAAYAVVMDGTGALPEQYSGRAGIERFEVVGKIVVIRIPTDWNAPGACTQGPSGEKNTACNHPGRWSRPTAVKLIPGDFSKRSELIPERLALADACGVLEDTRMAKRLIGNDGIEMRSAHLSEFVCQSPKAGVDLLRSACARAESHGFPDLFVSIPQSEFAEFDIALGPVEKVIAPATIYAAGLKDGFDWIINTSEI